MLEEFYQQLANRPPRLREQYVDLTNSPIFNPDYLKQLLSNINNLEIRDLYNILNENYKTVMIEICDKSNGFYTGFMLNDKFVTAFTQVINNLYTNNTISHEDIVYTNKIIYSFLTSQYSKDEHIVSLMMNLCRAINKKYIPELLGRGFTDDQASILAMNRFSSTNEYTNIQRLNSCIIQYPLELMSVQNIVNVYFAMTNKMTTLFEATMFKCDDKVETESQSEIYSRISLAILVILEDMPLEDIRTVLASYAGDYSMLYAGSNCRFSMNSLSTDYPRINSVVANMRHTERVFLP